MLIQGSCHCRNISFALAWQPDPVEIPARACTCSFCVKHGGVWTSHPAASLEVRIQDTRSVSQYTFGTHTAVFHVCARCGAAPVVTSEIEGRLHAVVSVNAFDNVDRSLLKTAPISFEEETEGARLARRQRGWVADVRFVGAPSP